MLRVPHRRFAARDQICPYWFMVFMML